jgi:hypothetical protein
MRALISRYSTFIRRYSAPLTVPLVLVFFLVPMTLAITWGSVVVPRLAVAISPIEESHPFVHSILHTVIGFTILPAFLVPQFLMIHYYQRYYERKKRERDSA